MKVYELMPTNGQKSFYKKAYVEVYEDGTEILKSYGTPIIEKMADGCFKRLWFGWSATTQKHIKAFCGMNKKEFLAL